jgi:poly(A) polymerase
LFPDNFKTDASRLLDRPGLSDLLKALSGIVHPEHGHEDARIVGGAVRDLIMDLPIGDIDVATTALPDAVMRMGESCGWKAVPTGIEHGTVTLVIAGVPYEITTLRRDIETDGRHAVVHFTRDFREDARRRDFTVNALSLSADGLVHDLVDGVADARNGLIRFVGEPRERIAEDYLRILRFYRFLASHGQGEGDPAARAACRDMRHGMARLSRERIGQEMRKLLLARRAGDVVALMTEDGILRSVLGEAPMRPERLQGLIDLETKGNSGPDWILRLAAVTSETSLPELLRLSRAEAQRLSAIRAQAAPLADAPPGLTPLAQAALLSSSEIALSALLLALSSRTDQSHTEWQSAVSRLRAQPVVSPYRALDFDRLGLTPGPQRGRLIARANALWIAADMPETRKDRRALLMQALAEL